jgi:HemY protein
MRKLIFYFIVLLLSIWLGTKIYEDSGYVLISYKDWSLETSFWFAVLMLVGIFFLIYIIYKVFQSIYGVSGRWHRWSGSRKTRKARKVTSRGLCELAEGNWQSAEKLLTRGADCSETPVINYLAAAYAAQQQQAYERRDNLLHRAHDCTHGAEEMAVGLTQAQLQLNSNQLEQALATLKHLNQITPHHVHVLKLLQQVYLKLADWKDLQSLLPELKKYQVLSEIELTQLQRRVYLALLTNAANASQTQALDNVWNEMPKQLHKDSVLVSAYADYLVKRQETVKAEKLLRQALKKNWSEELAYRYGEATVADPAKQLAIAESWVKSNPNDVNLLLTVGKICARNRLWGKARSYFESALRLEPRVEVYKELGKVLEQLGEQQGAMNCYKAGLQLCDNDFSKSRAGMFSTKAKIYEKP